jgi:hypothetical protein
MRPLQSFEPTPNAADWSEYVEVLDDETGTAWDLTGVLVEMVVRDAEGCRRLYGSTSGGELELEGAGFRFSFSADQMRCLCPGSYTAYCRATDSVTGAVEEIFIANLPIIEGGYR